MSTITPVPGPRRNAMARWLGDRRVNTKILLVVAALSTVCLLVGGLALVRMSDLNTKVETISHGNVASLAALAEVRAAAERTHADVAGVLIAVDGATQAAYETAVKADDDAVTAAFAAYTADAMPQQRWKDDVRTFTESWKTYQQLRGAELLPAARKKDMAAFQRIEATRTKAPADKGIAALEDLALYEKADSEVVARDAAAEYSSARLTVVLAMLLGLLAAVALALYIARQITRPLSAVSSVLDAVADGDLTRTADVNSRDELGHMARSLGRATTGIREAVGTMAGNADALASSSEQLAATSEQIAASAEESSTQATVVSAAAEQVSANVQTVAAGSEEMGASIAEIAHNANEAAKVAAQAVDAAAATTSTVSKLGAS
ncbi:MAG: methyl-accepting chemotaxis protein, partial [Actinomycetota bacterium]|nr:methyl-accepting chemotaxis protein [Actinomycetota bacterium]